MAFHASRPDNTPSHLEDGSPDSGRYLPGFGTQSSRMTGLINILPDLRKDTPGPGSMYTEQSGNPNASPSSGSGGPGNNPSNGNMWVRHISEAQRVPLKISNFDITQDW